MVDKIVYCGMKYWSGCVVNGVVQAEKEYEVPECTLFVMSLALQGEAWMAVLDETTPYFLPESHWLCYCAKRPTDKPLRGVIYIYRKRAPLYLFEAFGLCTSEVFKV